MRYLVSARLKPEREEALRKAIAEDTLGAGSVAEGEYLRDMTNARQLDEGLVQWVEVCFCPIPLQEERGYWEEYFELKTVKEAHDRRRCRDLSGEEPWACPDCDCTQKLEEKLRRTGKSFLTCLQVPK